MGNFTSRSESNTQYQKLEDEIKNLKDEVNKKADLNGDGIVTKKELEQFSIVQTHAIRKQEEEIVQLKQELKNKDNEINNWKLSYEEVSKKHQMLIDYQNALDEQKQDPEKLNSKISKSAVDEFVKDLLSDPNINIRMMPDSIESKIYANTILITLSSLQKIFNNVNLDVMGHELKIQMKPTIDSQILDMKKNDE